MDQRNDATPRIAEPRDRLGRYGPWLMAAIATVAIIIPLLGGSLPAAFGLPAIALLAVAAFYLSQQSRSSQDRAPRESRSPPLDLEVLTEVVARLPDPAMLLDADGRVAALNDRASTIAPALRAGDLASVSLRIPAVIEAIRRAGTSGRTERAEFSERVPAERWLEVIATPLPFTSEKASGPDQRLLLSFRDLTPIRRVEEMRVDFVANASHELRTPLAALSGFIETLKGPARNDAAARERFLDIMEAQAKRMARLIDDLLSLSRIELAAHIRPETPVQLQSIIGQVVDALQMLARDRGVAVHIAAPKDAVVVPGDRDELIRVFENLIENALKYGAPGKRVDITVSLAPNVRNEEEAVVAVRDYGPGISAEHLPRLTERFYRVDVTESRAQGGTGLGLALVKHIVNRHRGRIVIESRAGEGATFTVRLPVYTGPAGVPA